MYEKTKHAEDQMAARQVTDEHIRLALNRTYGEPRVGSNGNLVVLGYADGARILKVVLTPDRAYIVTVMWLDD
jgi:hypothetical protein